MSTLKNDLNDEPRDQSIAEAYRAAGQPEPPAALDDAIRAAARRALHTRPASLETAARRADSNAKRGFLRAWQTPLAAAATLALAIGVAIKVYDTGEANIDAPKEARTPTVATADKEGDRRLAVGPQDEMKQRAESEAPVQNALPESQRAPPGAKTHTVPGLNAGSAASSPPRLGTATAPESGAAPMVRDKAPRAPSEPARQNAAPAIGERVVPASPPVAENGAAASGAMALESRKAADPPSDRADGRQDQTLGRAMAPPSSRGANAPGMQADATTAPAAPAARSRSANERLAREAEPAQGFASGQRPEHRAVMEDRMAAGSSVSNLIAQLAMRPADAWFEEIRALKRAGRIADANALLAETKKRFPSAGVPQDLR